MLNSTQTAWFRLRKSEYGPKGEWALFKKTKKLAKKKTAAKTK
jgi:hypothetical protein